MIETEEGRKTRPAFYAVLAVAVLGSAVLWWVNRPRVPEFAEVTGVVTLDGKPLDTVEVRFQPDPGAGTRGPHSSCYTDQEGRYTIRCEQFAHDGAVPGTHRVVIFDITALPDVGGFGEPLDPSQPSTKPAPPKKPKVSRIPSKYEGVSTTPFVGVEVKRGTQELNFALESKAK